MTINTRNTKFWLGLGLATGLAASNAIAAPNGQQPQMSSSKLLFLAANSGEGEGGESAKAKVSSVDDATYLTQLALVEGHMAVGLELYAKGDVEAAKTHMKHPGDELYGALKPMLKSRKLSGFAKELNRVSKAVDNNKPAKEVTALADKLFAKIKAGKPKAVEANVVAKVVSNLLHKAADEFAEGVKDGAIAEIHEFQDAWGFTQVAAQTLKSLSDKERKEHAKEIEAMEKEIADLASLWPDITGKTPPTRQSKELAAAAARVELLALSIK